MIRLLLLIGMLSSPIFTLAQQNRDFGTWRTYLTQRVGVGIELRGDEVFAATRGGVLRYNRTDSSLSALTTIDGLHAIEATCISLLPETDQIILGYEDGTLNYFSDPSNIQVLTDINRSTTYPDRRINAIASDESRAYIATNFGLVVYDLLTLRPIADAAQFGDSPSNQPVLEITLYNNRIYLRLQNGLVYSVDKSFPNLRDPFAWEEEKVRTNLPDSVNVRSIGSTNFGLFMISDQNVWRQVDDEWSIFSPLDNDWLFLHTSPEAVAVSRQGFVQVVESDGSSYAAFTNGVNLIDLAYTSEGNYFFITQFRSMYHVVGGESIQLLPGGPRNNDCVRVAAGNGEIYVAPRGYNQTFEPVSLGDGVFYYRHDQGEWQQLTGGNGLPEEVSQSFARAHYDNQTDLAYLGAWGSGMVTLKDGVVQESFTCENANLGTTKGSCIPDETTITRVSGMEVDLNGNLWVSTDFGNPPLSVRNPEGNWEQIPRFKFPAEVHATDLTVDNVGNVWIVNFNRGLLVYTSNNTPFTYDDGILLNYGTGINRGSLPTDQVRAVVKDQDGFIWVGTSKGVSVIFDPFTVSTGLISDAVEPVFEQSPLLSNTIVNAIAVDGGNRKWIATEDGAYLVAPDGEEVIVQFTPENSPLLSSRVLDVAIDQSTGEVYFATDRGLVSYQGDATEGTVDCNELLVYPNPAFTDQSEPIAISGVPANSTIKITSISGMLVRELTALGGLATWDGLDNRGRKVRSGVYLALIADDSGETPCITKFVVIERNGQMPGR